ncbi:MAG TPA: TlpA disulfide reductase family protein [Hanamia sp.]|nr:TlpA disulfide reductase family protein [Hanamia sp.]
MKLIYCLMIFFCPVNSNAQSLQPLRVGDRLPDITINKVINSSFNRFNTGHLKRPIVLDFFATWCSGCIAALPYFDNLRESLKDSVQIIVVSGEPESKVDHLLQINPRLAHFRLPFVTSDTLLHQLFPHQSIPHEVWIDKNGIIKAITIPDYVNKTNLRKLIAGDLLHLPLKADGQRYNPGLTLYDNVMTFGSEIKFNSVATGYINNAARGFTGSLIDNDSIYRRLYFINMSPIALCMVALHYRLPLNRFIIQVRDTAKLININGKQHDWFIRHALSYEITIPVRVSFESIERHIFKDLGELTGTNIRIEKKVVNCFVLVRDCSFQTKDPRSKGGPSRSVFISENGSPVFVHNGSLTGLIKSINSGSLQRPAPIVIDESEYALPVDLELGAINIHDVPSIQGALQPYGFNLIQSSRLLEMVVITDSSKN